MNNSSALNPNPQRCTCDPDDQPPRCPRRHALRECREALITEALEAAAGMLSRLPAPDQERFREQIKDIKSIDDWNRLGNVVRPR